MFESHTALTIARDIAALDAHELAIIEALRNHAGALHDLRLEIALGLLCCGGWHVRLREGNVYTYI